MSLTPSKTQWGLTKGKAPKYGSPAVLREWISENFENHDAEYTISVQFCEDPDKNRLRITAWNGRVNFMTSRMWFFQYRVRSVPRDESFGKKK